MGNINVYLYSDIQCIIYIYTVYIWLKIYLIMLFCWIDE